MAIGWWRLIQKKHEQWSIWWLVHWRETLIAVSSATWWILGGKRPTGNASRVIYDGSVTPRAMLLGWRIPWDNENNFLSATRRRLGPETERFWDETRVAWNLILFRSLTFRRIKFADAFSRAVCLHISVIILVLQSSTSHVISRLVHVASTDSTFHFLVRYQAGSHVETAQQPTLQCVKC